MKSFHADNGSEFFNWPLWDYLRGPQRKVKFTRSRLYLIKSDAGRDLSWRCYLRFRNCKYWMRGRDGGTRSKNWAGRENL